MFNQRLLPVFISLILIFLFTSSGRAQVFTQDALSTEGLSGVDFGSTEWGDFDSDGDLDILLTGRDMQGEPSMFVYENHNGVFSDAEASLPGFSSSSAAWGDYDNDGDLDIVVAGKNASNQLVTRIFNNDTAGETVSFTPFDQELSGVQAGSVEWGDYDNDGDLDILLTGNNRVNRSVSFIYRNDLDADTGERIFSDIDAAIDAVFLGNATWGDYDNDGDLDILMTGNSLPSGQFTRVYENNAGAFTRLNVSLADLMLSRSSWGDYDNDGDLDILLSGKDANGVKRSLIYNNNNGAFTDIGALIQGAEAGAAEWGDCDNDGDLDVLITGLSTDGTPFTAVYENADGTFASGEDFNGVRDGTAAWGDYDNDGDLDVLVAGKEDGQNDKQILLYRNNATTQNLPPASPDGLRASFSEGVFLLEWNPAIDNETPTEGLTYNVRVGTVDFDDVLVGPMALSQGYRTLPATGNAQHNTFFALQVDLADLASNAFLTWNVQAVDKSYVGSPFSESGFIYLAGEQLIVEDVPGDEGGIVALTWNASHLDVSGSSLAYYSVWRRLLPEPDNISSASLVTPADVPEEFDGTAIRRMVENGEVSYWEWKGNQPAMQNELYSFVAPTEGNRISTEDGINHFMIVAHTSESSIYFDGQSSEGYSIDNVAPVAPSSLSGVKDGPVVSLSWAENQEEDLKHYLVYRSETPEFDVTSLTPLSTTTTPAFNDESSFPAGTFYYKVVAEDIHENLSEASEAVAVVIATSNEDESAVPESFVLHQNYPNPFNPNTLIQFDMPQAGMARLAIYNAYGQQIEVLVDEMKPAGQHTVAWQPEGLSSGTYFYRLETQDFVASKRMVFVK